jgi:hypothetical protein
MMTSDLCNLSLREVAQRLRAKDVSPIEVTQACLDRINATDNKLKAFVVVTADKAMEAARKAESEITAGKWKGELHGVPVAIKDLYDMKGLPTTASSKVRADHVAEDDSACVTRLQDAGAVIVGKTHTHEHRLYAWRLQRWLGGGGGGARLLYGHGLGHRRLDPYPRQRVRHRWAEADLWSDQPLRRDIPKLVAGSCRTADAHSW